MKVVRFNRRQLDKLSDIGSDVALVALASIVLPAVFDKFNLIMVILGLLTTLGFWILSIWLKREYK